MSIELVKEPLKINQTVGKELMQFSVQGDVIVPDVKPDIIKVLCVDGDIIVNNNEVQQDKAMVEGMVNFKIIYISSDLDRPVRVLNASLPFKEPIDIAGTRAGMSPEIDVSVLNTEFEILNERKILVKAIAQVSVRITNAVEVTLVTDVMGDDMQKLKENIKICAYIGEGSEKCIAKEVVELPESKPPIFEILRTDTKVSKSVKISDDKVIVTGEINVSTLYAAEDEERSLQTVDCQVPFTQFIDIMGIHEDAMCDAGITIKDVYVRVVDDEAGDAKGLEYEIAAEIDVKGFEWSEKEVILDTYSPLCRVEMESKEVMVSQLVNQSSSQVVVKNTFGLEEKEDITQIYGMFCKPYVPNTVIMDDKVSLEGVVDSWILYGVGEENNIQCCKQEIPYSAAIEIKGAKADMMGQAKLEVEHSGFNLLPGGEVEVRVVLDVSTKLYKDSKLKLINKIDSMSVDEQKVEVQPSITIYYVQPGDTLWSVGKRFNTTVEELIKLNEITNPDELYPGQQVLIQKKLIEKNLLKRTV